MCGICGVVYEDSTKIPSHLEKMMHSIRFRGPDDENHFIQPGVGLGHRRLSVIDLALGKQPMTDSQVTIVFNGEIYNFLEIRKALENEGIPFKTRSDTEVILKGYLFYGEMIFEKLAGMFAIAIWDARSQSLFLVRDRLGVKPLYWGKVSGGGIVFGSELTSVLESKEILPRLNLSASASYLSLGYVSGENSMLEGVLRLPPATVLKWTRKKSISIYAYWDFQKFWVVNEKIDEREALSEFGRLLDLAVEQRLIADVPLGAFLSGGLDSSTVTALMQKKIHKVKTFSIGFEEESFSELSWAKEVATRLGTEHTEASISAQSADLLLEISNKQDEPFSDTSIIPTYALCKMARQHVTVALSGDGADELLAGYITHFATELHREFKKWSWLLSPLRHLLKVFPESRKKVNFHFKARQFLSAFQLRNNEAHAWWRMLADENKVSALMTHRALGFDPFASFKKSLKKIGPIEGLNQCLFADYENWLLDDILVKVDRASMGNGLEVRSPFLDHRLVEFCASLPLSFKLKYGTGKQLLRHYARSLVPKNVLKRKKAGFNAPVADWITGSWKEIVLDELSESRIRATGLLNPMFVSTLLKEHFKNGRDHGYIIFSILLLSLWMNRIKPSISGNKGETLYDEFPNLPLVA